MLPCSLSILPFQLRRLQVIISLSSSGFERHLCLHRAFAHFDANGDGKVTLTEFATALQLLKPKPTTEQLMTLFRFFDPNNTGETGTASVCVSLYLLLTYPRSFAKAAYVSRAPDV